jgi:excisionase family DNA binding protein
VTDGVVRLDNQLLTAREVAELLRLPVSTVYELARTGRLPYLRIGRAMRFSQRISSSTSPIRVDPSRAFAAPTSAEASRWHPSRGIAALVHMLFA